MGPAEANLKDHPRFPCLNYSDMFNLALCVSQNRVAQAEESKYTRRKVRTASVSTVVSIGLVLFMLGTLGLILLNANKITNYVKENIRFQVIIKENVKEVEITQLKKRLQSADHTRKVKYIDKEEAKKILQKDLGEDFVDFLGYNPLLPSLDVNLKADYAEPDSIAWIRDDLTQSSIVKEVDYSPDLVQKIDRNVRKLSIILLGFSILLLIVAIALINNTIRLAIYSKRFLIRTMQLVGATRWFIQRPFLLKGLSQGLLGSCLAIFLIAGLIYLIQEQMQEFFDIQDIPTFAMLFSGVILMGLLISLLSTMLAVRKYLRIKPEKLF